MIPGREPGFPVGAGNDGGGADSSGMTLPFVLLQRHVEDVAVGGGVGFGEDGAAFGLVVLDVLVPGRIVPDHQLADTRLKGTAGGLKGGGMMPQGCLVGHFFDIGSLVVQQIHSADPGSFLSERSRVGAIRVRPRRERLVAEFFQRKCKDAAVRELTHHILSPLDRSDLSQREPIFGNLPLPHVELRLLLLEEETEGLYPETWFHIPLPEPSWKAGYA